jgi:peptidoglycan hydrolase-like protein with peptidoglycan-binding domain
MSQETTSLVGFEPPEPEPVSDNGHKRQTLDERIAPRRRRWPWILVGIVLGSGATIAIAATGSTDGDSEPLLQENIELSTVSVESTDLVEEVEWSGTLSAGRSVALNASSGGVVTSAVNSGETIDRGDVVATVGSEPVVALFGSVPMWRSLSVGDSGPDVLQLETNLVHLGFDPDGTVRVNDEYTSATGAMVELWEESLGLETTGRVPQNRVAVLAGPSTVTSAAIVGASLAPGAQLAVVDILNETIDVLGWEHDVDDNSPGAVTSVAAIGTPVEHGTILYAVDGVDVVAVVDSDDASQAVLDAFEAADVEEIESMLTFLGYDPNGDITVDNEVDEATTAAVTNWQEAVRLPTTGSIQSRDYVTIPEASRSAYVVDVAYAVPGDLLGEGRIVLRLGAPTLSVSAEVAVSEIDEFTAGDSVRVVQLDDTEFSAVVTEIADVASSTTDGQGAEPTVSVTFGVSTEPDELISGAVTIVTESSRIDDAIVVPTRALITLREGGFAVQVRAADRSTSLVGVELGVFNDGLVEIVDSSLTPGTDIVVPS